MNTPFLLALVGILLAGLAVALWRNSILTAELRATQLDRNRLEMSSHNNMRAVRAQMGYAFPEAVAVCDALESTLQTRCRVDLELLERRLMGFRRVHNARLLDAAGVKGGVA